MVLVPGLIVHDVRHSEHAGTYQVVVIVFILVVFHAL